MLDTRAARPSRLLVSRHREGVERLSGRKRWLVMAVSGPSIGNGTGRRAGHDPTTGRPQHRQRPQDRTRTSAVTPPASVRRPATSAPRYPGGIQSARPGIVRVGTEGEHGARSMVQGVVRTRRLPSRRGLDAMKIFVLAAVAGLFAMSCSAVDHVEPHDVSPVCQPSHGERGHDHNKHLDGLPTCP